jgi:hypothetical protein
MFLPHASVYLSDVRVNDIWLLLAVGALWEFLTRTFLLFFCKIKPRSLIQKEIDCKMLQAETEYKRTLGMSAFVETSKLERQILSVESDLDKMYTFRKQQLESVESTFLKYGNYQLAAILWLAYYSVPLLVVDVERTSLKPSADMMDNDTTGGSSVPGSLLRTMLFPISYVGIGVRLSRFGLPNEIAAHSVGALLVLWSSQVTVSKIMDVADAYFLQ